MKRSGSTPDAYSTILLLLVIILSISCREVDDLSPNQAPVAEISGDREVKVSTEVHLDGSGSFDPDEDSLQYSWGFISLPPTSTAFLSDEYAINTTFTPDTSGIYEVELKVSDGITSDKDTFEVFVLRSITVSTLAGDGTPGFQNGAGTGARFNNPSDIAIDEAGNLYVTDWQNHAIRMVTPGGTVSTYAGNGQAGYNDATGEQAQFNEPIGIDITQDGTLFVTDFNNRFVRIINTGQQVTTLTVQGPNGVQNALFSYPAKVAVNEAGNRLYVSEIPSTQQKGGNNRIMVVENDTLKVLAGNSASGFTDGQGANAAFNYPFGIMLDNSGNILVADAMNHSLRKVTPSGQVTTLSGVGTEGIVNGSLSEARYNLPLDLLITPDDVLYIADAGNFVLREIDKSDTVSTFAGNGAPGYEDGEASTAQFNTPYGMAIDSEGNIYVADISNHVIRKITIK